MKRLIPIFMLFVGGLYAADTYTFVVHVSPPARNISVKLYRGGRIETQRLTNSNGNAYFNNVELASGTYDICLYKMGHQTSSIAHFNVPPGPNSIYTANFSIATVTSLGSGPILYSFAIISDLHIPEIGVLVWLIPPIHKSVNTAAYLQEMVTYINDITSYYGIKFVMVTGDISDSGKVSQLSTAKSLLDDLGVIYVPLRGNHDVKYGGTQFNSTFSPVYSDLATTLGVWEQANVPSAGYYFEDFAFPFEQDYFLDIDFNEDSAWRFPAFVCYEDGGNFDWMSEHLNNPNTLIFTHHPLKKKAYCALGFCKPNWEDTDWVNVLEKLYDYKDNVCCWFAGHFHNANPQYEVDYEGEKLLDAFETGQTFYHPDAVHRGEKKSWLRVVQVRGELNSPDNLYAEIYGETVPKIRLTWTDNSNVEDGFKIYWSTDGTNFSLCKTVTAEYQLRRGYEMSEDVDVQVDQEYWFYVKTYKGSVLSERTDIIGPIKVNSWVNPPTNLTAQGISESEIKLSWDDNSDVEDGYQILRWNGSSYVPVGEAGKNATSFVDTALNRSTTYQYKVRAYSGSCYSDSSNSASGTTFWLSTPSNLIANALTLNEIKVKWEDNSNYEQEYIIERKDSISGGWEGWNVIGTVGVNDTVFYDNSVTPYNKYGYRVRASDGTHYSLYSNISYEYAIPIWSGVSNALADNNGRKIAVAPDGTICLVYTSEEVLYQHKVWYTESKDRGETWGKKICLGEGDSPSITVTDSGVRCVVFVDNDNSSLYYIYSTDGIQWSDIWNLDCCGHIWEPSCDYNPNTDSVFVVWNSSESGYDYIYEAHFYYDVWSQLFIDTHLLNFPDYYVSAGHPSVSASGNNPFVLWEQENYSKKYIFRSDWDGSSWSYPNSVSKAYSYLPQAGKYNGVWETGNSIDAIFYGSDTVGAITGWYHYPVVAEVNPNDVYVFWQDSGDIYWNVKMNGKWKNDWTNPEKFTNTSASSAFPQIALSQDKKYLYVVWVEGDNIPYQIKFERVPNIYPTTIHSPVNNANIELGSSVKITWGSGPNNTTNNINFGEEVSYNIYWYNSFLDKWMSITKNVHDTMCIWDTQDIILNNPEQLKLRVDAITAYGDTASDIININLGLYTSNGTALSYSNQRKVAVSGDTVHYVYTDGDSVFYAYYDGNYHKRTSLGEGEEPAIALDENHNPVVVWVKYVPYHSWIILSRFNNGNWTSPETLYSVSQGISSPGIEIAGDTLHLIYRWHHIYPIDGMPRSIEYRKYNLSNYAVIDSIVLDSRTDITLRNPSITKDNEHNLHFVWERQDSIYYQRLPENKEFIGTGEYPFIDYNRGVINVVWKEGNNIVRRRRWVKGDWEDTETIITGGNPKILGSSIVLYEENNTIKKSEWDKINWQTPTSIDTGITPQTALSGDELSILYLKPAGSEYQLTLTQMTDTLPWGKTDNTSATAPNNQRKVIVRDNQLHTVYDGYGKIYYRYNAECGIQNAELTDAEMSEDIVIGEGNNPAIASGDVLSFIYLKGDTLKYRYLSDTLSSEYTIETGVSAPPAITGRDNRVFIGAPKGTDISLISVLYTDEGISEDIKGAVSGSHPGLATDIMGNIHLAYQDNDTIYHKLWGDTIIDTIGEGTMPAINADGGMIDIAYQRGGSIYRRTEDLTVGEFNPEDSIGEGDNPQSYGFICGWNTTSGIVYKTWNGTEWEDGDILRGNYPQLRYIPGTTTYDVYIGKTDGNWVSGEWIKNISYPDKMPSLSATDSFGSGLNNAKRLVPIGDTLYLAYTSRDNIYLTYSEDKGRDWHWPVLVDKGEYPAMAADSSRKEIYIAYLQGYYPNTGYRIRFTGYRSDLTPLYDTTYIIYEIPEEPQPGIGTSHISSPPSITTSILDGNVHILWKQREITDPFTHTSEVLKLADVDKINPSRSEIKDVDGITSTILPPPEVASPSITEKPLSDGEIYLVWAPFKGALYFYDSTFVRDTVDTGNTSHPHIDWYNNYVSMVWTKDDTIIQRERKYDGPITFSQGPRIPDTTIAGGDEAVVSSSHLLWQTTSGDIQYLYDIFGNYDTTIVNTPAISGYPQEAIIGDTLIYVWTEGNGPYYILSGRLPIQAINYVYIEDLGKLTPSVFTVYRDTILSFSSQYYNTMDAGEDSLVYQFPGIDSSKFYRLRLYFYYEDTTKTKGSKKWKEHLWMNQVSLGCVNIYPDSLLVWDKLLPKGAYKDSILRFKIERKRGNYAILSALLLYQVEKPGMGGPQLEPGYLPPLVTKLNKIYPNPFTNRAVINYSIKERAFVSMKVYDILGRIRQTLVNEEKSPGYYSITFRPKYPTGIYFIQFQAGKYKKTEKIIIVK